MERIITYDALGRMTSKQAVTSVNGTPQVTTSFSLPSFDATKVHAMTQAQTSAGLFSSSAQTLTYTGFDKVSTLRQGNDRILFTYGYDHQRIGMQKLTPETSQAKDYVGSCEFITRSVMGGTDTKTLTYLTGPYGVFAVVESHNGTDVLHYILKDNLGSWVTITDANGIEEQQMSFDAWGNRRDPQTWANYTNNDAFEEPMFDRGFTGHEHLYSFGLINMNGRMYDPVMSSFLSADRYVQNPWSAQGFNRYAYCMYNPLKFVDPTGWLAGGGGGHGPDNPPPYVNFEGWTSGYLLNEVTVIPDNPSLSNTTPIDEVWYTPNMNGGGRIPHWSNVNNDQSNGSGGAGGGGSHGGSPNNTTPTPNPNVNVEIGSKLLITANLYTTIVAKSYYNELTRTWQDKLGVMRDFDFYGNQYTGGKNSFGKMMSNKYLHASRWLNGLGIAISTIQLASTESMDERIKYGSDIVFGTIGFAPGGGMISTFWFMGGRNLVFSYGESMGELIKDGINPGYPVYQPFK